jgi:predicted acylesterase/phospholipase RssA
MTPQPGSLATASTQPQSTPPSKLKPDDIQYLAFEGGGGKGFAYLGAIDILERVTGSDGRSIMARVKGFAGASAGAITALLLSIGYDFKAINKFLSETDFDSFFDPATPRVKPQVGSSGVKVTDDTDAEKAFIQGDMQAWIQGLINPQGMTGEVISALLGNAAPPKALTDFLAMVLGQRLGRIDQLLGLPTVAKVLLSDFNHYLAYLPNDMGLFSGQAARTLFDTLLQKAVSQRKGGLPSSYRNLNFRDHMNIFQKKLLVTGTNLRNGTTQLFSSDDTPYFPIADAVRISMGLPWVFKPYVLDRRADSSDPPCGVYVDGGVWNNLPFREFDSNPPQDKGPASAAVASSKASQKATPRTLGLRLEIVPVAKIANVFDLTLQMLGHGMLGSGESQVLDKYTNQCIVLDTRGLDLLSFAPPQDPASQRRILNRSRRALCRYFDLDIDIIQPSIRDDQDDLDSDKARQDAEACGSQ